MVKNLMLLTAFLLLAGCTGRTNAAKNTPAPSPAVCGDPGTIQRMVLDSPTQGYDYEYNLYLPPCYEEETEAAYPVLYLIPGRSSSYQAWFNAGAAQVADDMIHAGEIPPFIIVSTGDTDSDLNAELIHYDLIPHIEKTYRIRPERRFHAVAGASLGGVATYRIVFSDPARFASAGIFDNGATAGEEDRIRGWLEAMKESDYPRVFLNTGLSDDYMLERARVMIAILDEFKISHTEIFTEGDHTYPYWVSNFRDYLRWVSEDWR
ncbi:MAG: alpha/beta hydrolase-fold protein [Anaerolineales bacterium]